jgi:hypothetical protein
MKRPGRAKRLIRRPDWAKVSWSSEMIKGSTGGMDWKMKVKARMER